MDRLHHAGVQGMAYLAKSGGQRWGCHGTECELLDVTGCFTRRKMDRRVLCGFAIEYADATIQYRGHFGGWRSSLEGIPNSAVSFNRRRTMDGRWPQPGLRRPPEGRGEYMAPIPERRRAQANHEA